MTIYYDGQEWSNPRQVSAKLSIRKAAKGFITSGVVSLVFTVLAQGLALYGLISFPLARIFVLLAWLVAVVGVAVSERLADKRRTHIFVVTLVAAIILGAVFLFLDRYATNKKTTEEAYTKAPPVRTSAPGPQVRIAKTTTKQLVPIISQHGAGNGAVTGGVTLGPCAVFQNGGNNNAATGGNCGIQQQQYGNLAQRVDELVEALDAYVANQRLLLQTMRRGAKTPEERDAVDNEWAHSFGNAYRVQRSESVRRIRDECAALHISNEELDWLLSAEQQLADREPLVESPAFVTRVITGLSKIAQALKAKTTSPSSAMPSLPRAQEGPPTLSVEQYGENNGTIAGNVSQGPCSIFQSGGSGNRATTNCEPPPPRVLWQPLVTTPYPKQPVVRPQAYVTLTVDRMMENAKFAVVCDRPCRSLLGGVETEGYMSVGNGFVPNQDFAAFVIVQPNPLPSGVKVNLIVESKDDGPIRIVDVKRLIITGS